MITVTTVVSHMIGLCYLTMTEDVSQKKNTLQPLVRSFQLINFSSCAVNLGQIRTLRL